MDLLSISNRKNDWPIEGLRRASQAAKQKPGKRFRLLLVTIPFSAAHAEGARMNTPNVDAGRLERRIRRLGRDAVSGIHGFSPLSPFGAIHGKPLLHPCRLILKNCRLVKWAWRKVWKRAGKRANRKAHMLKQSR